MYYSQSRIKHHTFDGASLGRLEFWSGVSKRTRVKYKPSDYVCRAANKNFVLSGMGGGPLY